MPYANREKQLAYMRHYQAKLKKKAAEAKQIRAERDFYRAFFWELMKHQKLGSE